MPQNTPIAPIHPMNLKKHGNEEIKLSIIIALVLRGKIIYTSKVSPRIQPDLLISWDSEGDGF